MISLKSFITAIHDALVGASESLMDKNVAILDKYFERTPATPPDGEIPKATGNASYVPRTVTLEYPHVDANGNLEIAHVAVPLVTLVPFTMAHVEKAKFTANFEMDVVDGELQLNFASSHSSGIFRRKPKIGSLEITLSPHDTPEGIRLLVEGYDAMLKRQIS